LIHISSDDEYSSNDDNDHYIDDILCYQELSHLEIIDRCKFSNGHIVNARLTADKSIIQEEFATINVTERQDSTVNGENLTNIQWNTDKTYSTMLKLISGALVGGTNYSEIYITADIEEDDTSTTSDNRPSNTTKHHSNDKQRNIPTLGICCLPHVQTLSSLYLVKPIDINKSFKPSEELKGYIKHAKEKETTLLKTRKDAMSKIKWM
jgi:hypothetical protein